jgi:uncharacterized protein involved in type VI secretion and phage assembly
MQPFTRFRKLLAEFGLEYFNRYYGTYRGFVASNEDPEGLMRIKLKVPQIYGNKVYDYWAWPVGMYAGKDVGLYALPNEGDMVWVRFENGDPDYPIWEYGHWNKTFKVPGAAKSPKQKVFQTTSGLRMVFDDEKESITFWKSDKRVIEINKNGISMGSASKSSQPAVLGDDNEKTLNEIIDKLNDIATFLTVYATTGNTASASGTTAPLAPAYSKLLADAQTLATSLQTIKDLPSKTKSKVNTLD